MPAPKGNEYYLLAKNFVKPKKYQPKHLWNKAIEYFEWNMKHPLSEEKVFGTGKRMNVKKLRAMTIIGFCNFASIDTTTFENYEKDESYFRICNRIRKFIYQQKLEGSAADLLNPSIIAREIGLADKTELTGADGKDLLPDISNLSAEDLIALLALKQKIIG